MDSNLLIALWMAVQVPFVVWLSKGKRFAADEIPVFERYRTRVFVQSGGMLGTFTLLYLYMFFLYL
jgi:hypothetical protein